VSAALTLLLYFIIGVATDVVYAGYYLAISRQRVLASGVYSFLISAIVLGVLYSVFQSPGYDAIGRLLAYALGGSVGSAAVVWQDKHHTTTRRQKIK
jgi:hypothetical protein